MVKRSFVAIPLKLPSLNEYINECRKNRYAGATMKKNTEFKIARYIKTLPVYEKPVKIHFEWREGNKKRDLDNVAFAKKFILDALVKNGKLKDDNRKNVVAFSDDFKYVDSFGVYIVIEEIEE